MKNYSVSDHQLVKDFVNGDQASIQKLINRHKNRVFTYILLNVKNRELAEDLFQDTFIKVIRSLKRGKYEENGKFLSWVLRIAHNLIIDHFRKEKHLNTVSNDDHEMDLLNSKSLSDKTIEQLLVQKQIQKDIKRLIHYLPEEQKEVFVLRHYMDLSFK